MKQPSTVRSFRIDDYLYEALRKDAKTNEVKIADIVRERLLATLNTPYLSQPKLPSSGTNLTLEELFGDQDFINLLIEGAISSVLWMKINTGDFSQDGERVNARIAEIMAKFQQ
ncbi:MAG: hypothetical protein COA43_00470 [Robiginitomaculum sp.]|nr:MAG: hypothetical protein COA43_00470 [Robiginitomaculum sp.]